jgi:hypothetical protein
MYDPLQSAGRVFGVSRPRSGRADHPERICKPKGGKMEIGEIEKRFGALALEKGFITLDQLVEAMNSQVVENLQAGTHTPIGTIMVEKGWLDIYQINEVLRDLGKEEPRSGGIKEPSAYPTHLMFRPAL